MNKRRLHLVLFALLILAGSVPAQATTPGSVTGYVRDSAGNPQIGAVVQLLRPDQTVIASVSTNAKGRYAFATVLPGKYSVKAIGATFLPSMREGVRVRTATIVNLTMSTLYEVMLWLPTQPRSATAAEDDWKWTLRSAANRPLLRWLEDGPLVVVNDGSGARKLKARLIATGQAGTFGESGERFSATVEDTPSTSRELLARVDFDPRSEGGMESMLGFRQELGYAGSVQSMASISLQPEVSSAGAQGIEEALVDSSETMNFGDAMDAEIGSQQLLARFHSDSPNSILAALPYALVNWHKGASTIHYRLATALPTNSPSDEEVNPARPRLTMAHRKLAVERGVHQEIGWERRTDGSAFAISVFSDHVENPVLQASSHFASDSSDLEDALLDKLNGLMRASAADYSSMGVQASFEHSLLNASNRIRLSYANGGALVLPTTPMASTTPQPISLARTLAAARPHRAQTYSLTLSGTLEGTGTHWQASYRWQPSDTVTSVTPFAQESATPYLNLHLRQPLHLHSTRVRLDALVNVRNLLAEGYRPYLLSDGSLLVFAQDQRGFNAGLAFTF